MTNQGRTPIGFIGLGAMGEPMALNLRKMDVPLVVWNRTPAKSVRLADAGANVAAAPSQVFERCEIILLMSPMPRQSIGCWDAANPLSGSACGGARSCTWARPRPVIRKDSKKKPLRAFLAHRPAAREWTMALTRYISKCGKRHTRPSVRVASPGIDRQERSL